MNEASNPEFFYCYSPNLFNFFRRKGIKYICTGLNADTMKRFWQYKSVDVDEALGEWRKGGLEKKGAFCTLSE